MIETPGPGLHPGAASEGRAAPPTLVDFTSARADALVALWRHSFEEAVGMEDPHPVAEQRNYLETEVLPRNKVKVLVDESGVVGFVAASPESIAQLYERHGFIAVARGFEPEWNLEDVRYEWRRGA